MRFFGPTLNDYLNIFVKEINAELCTSPLRVEKVVDDFSIKLEYISGGRYEDPYTCISSSIPGSYHIKARMFNEYAKSYTSSFSSMIDVVTEDSLFDEKFIIRSNSELTIKILLSSEELKAALLSLDLPLTIEIDHYLFETYDPPIELKIDFKIPYILKNNEQLKVLFEIMVILTSKLKEANAMENLDLNKFNLKDQLQKSFENIVVDRVIKESIIPISNNLFNKAKSNINEKFNRKPPHNNIETISVDSTLNSAPKLNTSLENKHLPNVEIEEESSLLDKNISLDIPSINMDNLKVNTSNLNVDTSKLSINTDDLKIDMSIFDKKD